jgi:hypothetical protein
VFFAKKYFKIKTLIPRYVVLKLVLFEFVNTFLSLFYVAFYLQDMAMLKSQVFTMLIVIQIVNQVPILPKVTKYWFSNIFNLHIFTLLMNILY